METAVSTDEINYYPVAKLNYIRETIESFLLNDDNESSLLQKEPSNVSPDPSQ